MNRSFLLLVLRLLAMLFGSLVASPGHCKSMNGVVLQFTSLGLIVLSGFLNVEPSNPKFGTYFTLPQVDAAIGIIVPLVLSFSLFRSNGVMSDMTR